ncbi:MAG: glycosyltransferase [Acidimicrobiales bacterium]|jgi:trehalose synthase
MASSVPGPNEYLVREVDVPVQALSRFQPIIGSDRYSELRRTAAVAAMGLRGRTIWNFNSTASGGGVAEMLEVLVGYIKDVGIDIRWHVISGDADFFSITKRVHNRLHGISGDAGELGAIEVEHYASVTAANASSARTLVQRGDVVFLHDPQTAGMAAALAETGAHVVWRCHIGREGTNRWTDQAWSFLRPHLADCEAYVFSRRQYVPRWMDASRVHIIPPSIDPFSPKNQEMTDVDVIRSLQRIGLVHQRGSSPPGTFVRSDGRPGLIERPAAIIEDGPPLRPEDRLVIQVSRWDRLKDMKGVMEGFALTDPGRLDAHLALVGPQMDAVSDDPEGVAVFDECASAWEALPSESRRRVRLVTLPMDDVDENAAMVNALQRHATIVVQKSLMEGFGLTVAEGMWKGRAVVASRVGGIIDQIASGTGILLDDPADLVEFGRTLSRLLTHPAEIAQLGERARQHVLDHYVGDKHLEGYAALIEGLGP